MDLDAQFKQLLQDSETHLPSPRTNSSSFRSQPQTKTQFGDPKLIRHEVNRCMREADQLEQNCGDLSDMENVDQLMNGYRSLFETLLEQERKDSKVRAAGLQSLWMRQYHLLAQLRKSAGETMRRNTAVLRTEWQDRYQQSVRNKQSEIDSLQEEVKRLQAVVESLQSDLNSQKAYALTLEGYYENNDLARQSMRIAELLVQNSSLKSELAKTEDRYLRVINRLHDKQQHAASRLTAGSETILNATLGVVRARTQFHKLRVKVPASIAAPLSAPLHQTQFEEEMDQLAHRELPYNLVALLGKSDWHKRDGCWDLGTVYDLITHILERKMMPKYECIGFPALTFYHFYEAVQDTSVARKLTLRLFLSVKVQENQDRRCKMFSRFVGLGKPYLNKYLNGPASQFLSHLLRCMYTHFGANFMRHRKEKMFRSELSEFIVQCFDDTACRSIIFALDFIPPPEQHPTSTSNDGPTLSYSADDILRIMLKWWEESCQASVRHLETQLHEDLNSGSLHFDQLYHTLVNMTIVPKDAHIHDKIATVFSQWEQICDFDSAPFFALIVQQNIGIPKHPVPYRKPLEVDPEFLENQLAGSTIRSLWRFYNGPTQISRMSSSERVEVLVSEASTRPASASTPLSGGTGIGGGGSTGAVESGNADTVGGIEVAVKKLVEKELKRTRAVEDSNLLKSMVEQLETVVEESAPEDLYRNPDVLVVLNSYLLSVWQGHLKP